MTKKFYHFFITGLWLLLSACLPVTPASLTATASFTPPPPSNTPTGQPLPSATPAPRQRSSPTLPPPTQTPAPTRTPTPVIYVTALPGQVDIPILLYHRISDSIEKPDAYSMTVSQFREQMELLRDWGYTPLGVTAMVNLLQNGGPLPLRPVIITFDDGYLDVYQNAYPLLKELGFPGVVYIIVKAIGADTSLSADMIRELASAGWEIGNHSYSHPDLTKSNDLRNEICFSKLTLEEIAGVEVQTFAYPYGRADKFLERYVRDCGYYSGAGLGPVYRHVIEDIYFFNRLPVDGTWSLAEFAAHLPWKQP